MDVSHIAVVTVRDVFLDDEKTVLSQLSDAVGYEVKALRSVVVSDDISEDVTRHKRETNARTSLQLYVYGLVEQEPVVVTKLTRYEYLQILLLTLNCIIKGYKKITLLSLQRSK